MLKTHAFRKAGIAILAAGLVAALAPAATSAGPKLGFDLRAAKTETKGGARAVGTVRVIPNRTRRKYRAVLEGRLNDLCPKDGYGAYLDLRAYYNSDDPDVDTAYSSDRGSDIRECPAGAKRVRLKTGWIHYSERIYEVSIQLFEYDVETGDIAFSDEDRVAFGRSQFDPDPF